jgi:hypothetical protein
MTPLSSSWTFWTHTGARGWARALVIVFCALWVGLALLPLCLASSGTGAYAAAPDCVDGAMGAPTQHCPGAEVALDEVAPASAGEALAVAAFITASVMWVAPLGRGSAANRLRSAPHPGRAGALYRTTLRLRL